MSPLPSLSNSLKIWLMKILAFCFGMSYKSTMLSLSTTPEGQTDMKPLKKKSTKVTDNIQHCLHEMLSIDDDWMTPHRMQLYLYHSLISCSLYRVWFTKYSISSWVSLGSCLLLFLRNLLLAFPKKYDEHLISSSQFLLFPVLFMLLGGCQPL